LRLGEEATALSGRVEVGQLAQQTLQLCRSSLETQIESDRVTVDDKIALLSKIRDDVQKRFRQLADKGLKTHGDAFIKAKTEKH